MKSLKKLSKWGWSAVGRAFLPEVVALPTREIDGFFWPTITASQAGKPIRKPSLTRRLGMHGYDIQDKLGEIFPELIGKKVNILFMEWMMGYPSKWTELEPLETQWYQLKRKKRSKS